jgi:hypothetical protein
VLVLLHRLLLCVLKRPIKLKTLMGRARAYGLEGRTFACMGQSGPNPCNRLAVSVRERRVEKGKHAREEGRLVS